MFSVIIRFQIHDPLDQKVLVATIRSCADLRLQSTLA